MDFDNKEYQTGILKEGVDRWMEAQEVAQPGGIANPGNASVKVAP